ncbi:MAG: peptide chain release factor N(5)-glutamine methyltransferase [Rikenellaceae bacterium]
MQRVELYNLLTSTCEPIYGAREAEQIARMILAELAGVSLTHLILEPSAECHIENLDTIIDELSAGRPVQYIIGEADFCSFRFAVREGVLIPRPETEELVFRIVEECEPNPRILDVGCGSGAISVSLAKLIEGSEVWAVDVSTEALAIARENNLRLGADVNFLAADALVGVEEYVDGEFDIVVSNPPYIPQSEECDMRTNVTSFEPHIALFVEDDNPLVFYKAIAKSALKLLKREGLLYFEIHESLWSEVVDMLRELGYIGVTMIRDINDKPRIICAEKG